MTLSAVYLLGGAPWLRHFAFPVLFFLVAVPWPRPQESSIMGWLMLRNTGFCVEALHWLGYAAEQRGNLIAIPGSMLGVEEACSGIRSLQSNIMVALAVGEFFRLTVPRRIVLFLLGLGAALGGNAIRSLTLSVAACRSGTAAVDQIHDGTGLAVMLVSSALVLLAGKLLSRTAVTKPAPPLPQASAAGADLLTQAISLPVTVPLAAIVLWSAAWIGSEAWFRWHESKAPAVPLLWALAPPGPDDQAREVPIAERTLDILLFPDQAYSEQWRDENGWQWQAFYFRWAPGPTSVQSAFVVHDPRTCLGAAGFELERKFPRPGAPHPRVPRCHRRGWTTRHGRQRVEFRPPSPVEKPPRRPAKPWPARAGIRGPGPARPRRGGRGRRRLARPPHRGGKGRRAVRRVFALRRDRSILAP
jgi:exosortase